MANLLSGITAKLFGKIVPLHGWPMLGVGVGTSGNLRPKAVALTGSPGFKETQHTRKFNVREWKRTVTIGITDLIGYRFSNPNGQPVYVKFYDALAADVVVGTTIPVLVVAAPAQGDVLLESGGCAQMSFSTGMVIAVTGEIADSDTTAPEQAIRTEIFYRGSRLPTDAIQGGLLAYYSLDETSGTRDDSSGNGYGMEPTGSVGSDVGVRGNAAVFSTGSYLSSANLNVTGLQAFSVSGWIKFNAIYNYEDILGDRRGTGEWNIHILKGDGEGISVSCFSNNAAITSTIPTTAGNWLFFVLRWDGEKLLFQCNDEPVQAVDYTGETIDTGNPFYLGQGWANEAGFTGGLDGSLDEVGIWGRSLTDDEVDLLYQQGLYFAS